MANQSVLQNIRQHLGTDSSVNAIVGGSTTLTHARIFINHIPQETINQPHIWIGRSNERREQFLNGTYMNLTETKLDVECITIVASSMDDLVKKVKARLEAAIPGSTMGSDAVKAVIVEDHDDTYIPFNAQDNGNHIAALQVTVWHST